jgi:hypothetical protein
MRFPEVKQGDPARAGKGRVSRGSGEIQDRWGLWDFQGFQALERLRGGLRDLPDRPVGARQLSQFDLLEIVADVAPGIDAGLLGEALQEEREHGEGDVGVDAVRRPMVDGTQLQATLQLSPGNLHALQLLVAEGEVGGTQGIVVAVHDELPVELGERLNVRLIDPRVTVRGEAHVAAISSRGTQLADALGVGFAARFAQALDLGGELIEHLLTMARLPLGLLRVVTDDIPATALPVPHSDFRDLEVLGDSLVVPGAARASPWIDECFPI